MPMRLELRPEASLRLAPQLQYALQLLQMDAAALAAHIQQQALENPLISLDTPTFAPAQLSFHSDELRQIPDTRSEHSLQQDLHRQLPPGLSPEMEQVVCVLIELLDPSGLLLESDEELASALGMTPSSIRQAVELLQGLEPAGIGARSVSECLCLQLQRREDADPLAQALVQRHLPDIAAGHLRKIARSEGISLRQVEQAVARIRTLSPYPVTRRSRGEQLRYIVPDLEVRNCGGTLSVALTEFAIPKLYKDPVYADLLRSADPQVAQYLRNHADSFDHLESAIAMRSATMLEVAQVILERQQSFFLDGTAPLQPLSLYDISQKVQLHISTVSKALRDKYILCPWGVFPLRHFLSRYVSTPQGEGPDVGQDQVCQAIRQLIDREDPAAPLSDQAIFLLLQQRGLVSSRRTVTFYREKMGLPVSYLRKKSSSAAPSI